MQPQVAAAASSTQAARRLPKLDDGKLAMTHEYKKIEANGFDSQNRQKFKTGGKLKVGGAKNKMQKDGLIYIPALRLAGTADVLQGFLTAQVEAGLLPADRYNNAIAGLYNYENSVAQVNGALEAEIAAAASQKASAVAASSSGVAASSTAVKSQVTLQQLIDLHHAMGRTRSKGTGGKTADKAGRKAKSPLEKIQEARTFNTTAGTGQAYKYLHYTQGVKGESSTLKAKPEKSVGVLARDFPLAAKTPALLREVLLRFRNDMGADLYNRAMVELQQQGN